MDESDQKLLDFIAAPLFKGLNGSICTWPGRDANHQGIYEACRRLEDEGHLTSRLYPVSDGVIFEVKENSHGK